MKPICRGRQPAITDLVPLQKMIRAAEDDPARPITRLALRMLALTAVRPSELRGAGWAELEDLNGKEPVWTPDAPGTWRLRLHGELAFDDTVFPGSVAADRDLIVDVATGKSANCSTAGGTPALLALLGAAVLLLRRRNRS